jgi:hypothetical protein
MKYWQWVVFCSFQLGFTIYSGGLLHYLSGKNLFAHYCTLFWFAHDLIEIWSNIKFYLFTLLKVMGWGVYHFCSGVLVVTSLMDFY